VMMAASRLTDLKVYELKAVCRAKGLKVSGRKAELIERIAAAPPGVAPDSAVGLGRGRGRGTRNGRGRGRPARVKPPPPVEVASHSPSSPLSDVPSPPPAAPLSWSGTSGVVVEAEVLGRDAGDALDDETRRAERRASRRAKLSQYFEEEYNTIVGALGLRAGDPYLRSFGAGDAPVEALQAPPPTSQYIEAIRRTGRRLAWCRSFDVSGGAGVIVDLEEKREWSVDRAALCVGSSMDDARAMLHSGEFVEYELEAARAFADSGAAPSTGWVCGILGWPLMCESAASIGMEAEQCA
jgi:hypothetical protein